MEAQRIAKFFLVLSVATLFYRNGIIWLVKPFEIFILLACVFFIADVIQKKENIFKTNREFSLWAKVFALFFLFSVIGTINGYRIYGLADPVRMFGGFFYIGVSTLAFFLLLYYGRNRIFRNNIVTAFYSPLVFAPLIFLPQLLEGSMWLSDGIHFRGTHHDSVTFSFLAFIAFVVAATSYIHADNGIKKFLYWVGSVVTLSLVIWTGSRVAWFSTFAAFLWVVLYLYFVKYRGEHLSRRIRLLTAFVGLAIISALLSFGILPHQAKIMALDRLYPNISNYFPAPSIFSGVPLEAALEKIRQNPIPSFPYQSRREFWAKSLETSLRNPFGLGVEYFRSARIAFQGGKPTHSHNTFLQAALTGGIGLLAVYLFIILRIAKTIATSKKDSEWLIFSTAMIGSLFFSLTNEFLYTVPWIWVVAALLMAKESNAEA